MNQKTITINGTVYDAVTGLPVTKTANSAPATPFTTSVTPVKRHTSQSIHHNTQKSHTLNRRVVRGSMPQSAAQPAKKSTVHQKSAAISKFAPHPQGAKQPHSQSRVISDFGPAHHPMVAKANAHIAQQKQHAATAHAPKPSQIIKQEAIRDAMSKAPAKHERPQEHKSEKQRSTKSRFMSIASASLALLLLGGYFTYLNMPNLSVRVAAAQAGIDASYPEYRPDGYSLNGPVAFNNDEVQLKFAANGGPHNFTISQSKSSWDSSAVLSNYVEREAGDKYITYNERGLTIYTYETNAAWVNGGILYKINGDAPLSSDQIRRIATSM